MGRVVTSAAGVLVFVAWWYLPRYMRPVSPRFLSTDRGAASGLDDVCHTERNGRAFATLYSAQSPCYDLALAVLLKSFQATNSSHRMLVLHGPAVSVHNDLLRLGGWY